MLVCTSKMLRNAHQIISLEYQLHTLFDLVWRRLIGSEISTGLLPALGPGTSVGLATGYGLEVQGSNPGGREIFRTCPDRPWGPTSLLYNGYRVFPGVKSGRDVTLTPHPLLVTWSRNSRTIPLLPLWTVRPVQGCTLPYFTLYI